MKIVHLLRGLAKILVIYFTAMSDEQELKYAGIAYLRFTQP